MSRSFVLLRGLGRESRHWGKFPSMLEKENFCSKVFLCDLPGAGPFHKEHGVNSISKMLSHLVKNYQSEFMKNKPLSILGFSLGGMLTMEYVTQYPTLFSEFILINSSLKNLSPFYKRLKFSALPKLFKIASSNSAVRKEHLVLELTSQMHKEDSEVLKEHVVIAESAPMTLSTLLEQILAAATYKGPSKELKVPGLILYSKKDELVNPECSIELAKTYALTSFAHEEAGHDLVLDDPEWVLEKMREFYKGRDL